MQKNIKFNFSRKIILIIGGSKGIGKELVNQYLKDPSWQLEVDEFIDSIINNNKIKNGNCEDALKTMSLVTRIYKSKNYE